jgi:hypothetical protein
MEWRTVGSRRVNWTQEAHSTCWLAPWQSDDAIVPARSLSRLSVGGGLLHCSDSLLVDLDYNHLLVLLLRSYQSYQPHHGCLLPFHVLRRPFLYYSHLVGWDTAAGCRWTTLSAEAEVGVET